MYDTWNVVFILTYFVCNLCTWNFSLICSRNTMAPSRGPQTLARKLHTTLSSHRGPVHVVRYAKGSAKYILSGGQDRTVRLWNPDSGAQIKSFEAHGYEVLSISV